ncbi:unnamed protein product, partial [Effrenium voratum]
MRNLVDMFFLELYHQSAEDLPETFQARDVDLQIAADNGEQAEGEPQSYMYQVSNVAEIFSWTPEAAIAQNIMALSTVDLSAVPIRHLPPGKPMSLFWQFQAWCEAAESLAGSQFKAPSWSTFWRVWWEKWSHVLRFRKTSQHKECNTCHSLREKLQGKKGRAAEKMALARDWREHLRAQYHDRLIYWSLRWASRASLNVLTIIIDSMGQVKTAWPQYKFPRKPHSLENQKRPRVILSAVLCHGWCTNVYISDESLHHGASSFCELIARSLDRVADIAGKKGRAFPQHLVIQVPEELVALVREKTADFVANKGEELFVEQVAHIRNFDAWLGQLKVHLRNCFVSRGGKLSAHSFVYKCRCHLTPKEAQQLPPDQQGVEAHDHDVYALTKGRMHGTSFHPPVLALPRKRVEDCALSPVPCDCKTLAEGADKQDRLKKLTKLADTLESLPHDFTRAVPALRGLIEQLQEGRVARPEDDAPPLKWLGAAPPERSEVPLTRNMYYEHLPDTSWQLLATFHRMPAALLKLKQSISATFSGSSDPEAFDCVHIVDHLRCKFSEPRHLKVCFEQLYQRARAVEPAWVRPRVAQCVPEAPGPQQEAGEGWLFIWQLAHEDGCSLKGRSNMVNILETAFSILENTFNSVQNPLDLLFSGTPIGDFSVNFSVGLGRSLAIKMILLAMVNLSNEELRAVFPVLRSLFTVKFTYNPAPNEEVQRHRSLSAKFQASESHRPDPIQIYHVLADSLAKAGQDVAAGLPRKIKEYNSLTSVQSQCISELEARVICLLPQQTVKFRETLAYHWQNYKNAESGVPMKLFGKSGILGADAPAEASGVWKEILKPSAEKNECFLLHIIHVFVKSLKDALRMKKKPNLRFHANTFRVSDPVSAYYQACLWVHFRPEMQREMSGDEFEQLERTFLRGSLERELADRVKAMNPTLKLGDFRFLYLHLGKDAPAGKEPIELEAAQEVAEFEQEKAASLRLFKAKLDKDVSLWTKYCTSLADFTSMQKVGKVEFLRHQDRMISKAVEKQADAQFPIRCLGLSDNVAPFVSSCASTWAEKQIIPACSLFTVYIANLTSLGSAASRGMKEVARLISDACAHNAQRTMAIIISPNVAGHGHTYEEQETVQVQDEVENFLRKEEYNLKTRRGQIVFSNESINSRTRPSVHPMIMCMSNQTKDDGELACLFGSSQLWHRRAVPLVKMKPNSEYVLPMQGQTVVAAENLSKAQMHKQHISGVDLMDKLKEWLWKGMNMSQQFGAVYVDLLPYDDSLLLSTVQGLARARPKEPQEMVVTCCWARGDQDGDVRKKNAEWLTAAVGRAMDRLIRQKLLSLPNVVVKEYTPEGTTPTNDSSLYSLTCPTADGNLAMRQN